MLDLTTWKRHEAIALQEIEHTLTQQIGNNANVISEVKAVPKMNTLIAIALIVRGQSRQNSQLDSGRVPVFGDGTNDLDRAARLPLLVICFDYLTKCSLTQEFDD